MTRPNFTVDSVGTIASAFVLLWAGRLIDRTSLARFSIGVVAGLVSAALLMSTTAGIVGLTFAFFFLRFFGQGLMIHAAMTTMARYFHAERGRAVSLALTGHVAGGALLPLTGVALLSVTGWRQIWILGAIALALVTMPLIATLLARARRSDQQMAPSATPPASGTAGDPPPVRAMGWTLGEVLRERGLYARLGVLLAPAFITTGLIFHQVHLGAQKGWDLALIATGLSAYALGSFILTLGAGFLVDRISARLVVPFALAPMAAACFTLLFVTSPGGALLFFGLLGFGTGLSQVVSGAIWAELYGTTHLGAIRSFAASASVLSSGLAPGIFGLLMDRGWTVESLALLCAIYCIGASVVAGLLCQPPRRRPTHVPSAT